MPRWVIALCAAGLALGVSASPRKVAPEWLLGTWVVCEDPDASPQDALQFHADGTGLVIRNEGRIAFEHRRSPGGLTLLAQVNGERVSIEVTVSQRKDRMLLYSDRARSAISYVRPGSREARRCSIR